MRKLMKKITAMAVAATMVFGVMALTGCGGKDETYEFVSMTMFGMEMSSEDMGMDMTLVLKGNGKAEFWGEGTTEEMKDEEYDGVVVKGEWEADGDEITVTLKDDVSEMTMEGVKDGDEILFEDWLETGAEALFELE